MDNKTILIMKSIGLGVVTVLALGIGFHLVGLNSHSWMVLLLLVGATVGIVFYQHNRPVVAVVVPPPKAKSRKGTA